MRDIGLQELLASRGLVGRNADMALDRLCEQGLTRPGKSRVAVEKIDEVDRTLSAAFARYCGKTACLPPTPETRKAIVVPAKHCEFCGGSDNRRAVEAMLAATHWPKPSATRALAPPELLLGPDHDPRISCRGSAR